LVFKMLKQFHHLAIKTYPNLVGSIDPLGVKRLIDRNIFQIVKRTEDKGPVVLVVRVGNWHISDGSIADMGLAALLYLWTVSRMSFEIQREGVIAITDMSGFKLKHARQLTIELVKMGLKFYSIIPPEIATDVGSTASIAFNSFTLVEETYNAFKGLLPKDIKKMVHITKNDTSVITKLVPKDKLPMEFGGSIPDEEAYIGNIAEQIEEAQFLGLVKYVQDEMLETYGLKRREKKVKKDKKDKKAKGEADKEAQIKA